MKCPSCGERMHRASRKNGRAGSVYTCYYCEYIEVRDENNKKLHLELDSPEAKKNSSYNLKTCMCADCERHPVSRKLCNMHDARWRQCGEPNKEEWAAVGGPTRKDWMEMQCSL
jgi:hypothetical protein